MNKSLKFSFALIIFCSWVNFAFAGQGSLNDSFIFLDEHERNSLEEFGSFSGKPWKEEEKMIIGAYFGFIDRRGKGLLLRASALRPIKLYRNASFGAPTPIVTLIAEHGIVFTDMFFEKRYNVRPLAHELVHLADAGLKISNSKEWAGLIQPLIRRVQQRLENEGLSVTDAVWIKQVNRENIAHEEGLPTLYAASDEMEALAENTAELFMEGGFIPPAQIKNFIDDKLLSLSFEQDESMRLFDQGLKNFLVGKSNEAIDNFTRAVKVEPDLAEAYLWRAKAWSRNGNIENAITDLSLAIKALRISKINRAYYERAEAFSKLQRWDEAIADYSQAIKGSASWTYPLIGRGKAWFNKKEYDKAIADYDKVIMLNPKNAQAYVLRADNKRFKTDYDGAIADFSEAIRLAPGYAGAFFWRGLTYYLKNNLLKAKSDFQEALRIDPQLGDTVMPWLAKTEELIAKQ